MFVKKYIGKKIIQSAIGLFCMFSPVTATGDIETINTQIQDPAKIFIGWKEFHSTPGRCSMEFPTNPEHISEKMMMPNENIEFRYDAYISAADSQTVFMLLVAQYPELMDSASAKMNLEGFLNAVLTHNPDNQLLVADLILVEGHTAIDFFIRSKNIYFKGRAMMVKNSLYLMAMECEVPHYNETQYSHFVSSFKLHPLKAAAG